MFLKNCKCILVTLPLLVATSVKGQSAPAVKGPNLRFSVGAEFSGFGTNVTAKQPFEYGVGSFADFRVWHSLGLELEGRTIQFEQQENVRQDILSGGLRYAFPMPRLAKDRLIPYGKWLVGDGSADFPRYTYRTATQRQHDTFTVMTVGGGADYVLTHRVLMRAEFEYQWWFDYGRGLTEPGLGIANPRGFSIGAAYRFF